MFKWLRKLFEVEDCRPAATLSPCCWTLSWIGTIELAFPDGKYLPRHLALMSYPQYFKDGEPILDMLPMNKPKGV